MDILSLLAWFSTTWPIPNDNSNTAMMEFTTPGASGNQATCSVQGFFSQLSISVVLYNAFLAIYFMLVIRFGWTEAKIQQIKLERYIHGTCIAVGLVTSSIAMGLDLYNPAGWYCSISPYPAGCRNDSNVPCQRGENALLYSWFLFYLPLWISVIVASIALYEVYAAFQRQHQVVQRWKSKLNKFRNSRKHGANNNNKLSSQRNILEQIRREHNQSALDNENNDNDRNNEEEDGQTNLSHRLCNITAAITKKRRPKKSKLEPNAKSKLVTSQALLYVSAFYVAWIFPSILKITETASSDNDLPKYHWVFLSAFFMPLQGLMNFIIYLRPKYIQIRQIKKRIDALAKQQEERKQQQKFMQHQDHCYWQTQAQTQTQLLGGRDNTTTQVSHSSSVPDEAETQHDQNFAYGRHTAAPLIDDSSSLQIVNDTTQEEAEEAEEESLELTMDYNNTNGNGNQQNDGDGREEPINQLHASFAGNLPLTRLMNRISAGTAASNKRASVGGNSSSAHSSGIPQNNHNNNNIIAPFNDSLNLDHLEDLLEEKDEDDSSQNQHQHKVEDDTSSSSEQQDTALDSLFDAMTQTSGCGSHHRISSKSRNNRRTLKRSNSSEYNFTSMRSIEEDLQVNPSMLERFNASMNIGSDGRVLKRSKKHRDKRKQEPELNRHTSDQHTTYYYHKNRAMEADANPMNQSVPLTIESSHRRELVPLTIGSTDNSNQGTDVSRVTRLSLHSSDEKTIQSGDNKSKNELQVDLNDSDASILKRVSFEMTNDDEKSDTSRPIRPTDEKGELREDMDNHVSKEKAQVNIDNGNHDVARRKAGRRVPRARRVKTDPDRLEGMKMGLATASGSRKERRQPGLRRNLTAPNANADNSLRSSHNSNASTRRRSRRLSDGLSIFRQSGNASDATQATGLLRTRRSSTAGEMFTPSDVPSFQRSSTYTLTHTSDRSKQMMFHAKENQSSKKRAGFAKKAGSQFKSMKKFAVNVKDALRADDLSDWTAIINDLEMDLSSSRDNEIDVYSLSRTKRNLSASGEEEKQEIQAVAPSSPGGDHSEGLETRSPSGSPQKPKREDSSRSRSNYPKPKRGLSPIRSLSPKRRDSPKRTESSPTPAPPARIPRKARLGGSSAR